MSVNTLADSCGARTTCSIQECLLANTDNFLQRTANPKAGYTNIPIIVEDIPVFPVSFHSHVSIEVIINY